MESFGAAFSGSLALIASGDPYLLGIVLLSLKVSLFAVLISALIGIPLGGVLATSRFPGRTVLIVLINALMGLPPVVVGLSVYLLLSRAGPFGVLDLLYTPTAMIIAQTILATPIVAALSRQLMEEMNGEYAELFASFRLSRWARVRALVWDGRFGLITAILAGFGRATAEVGAVLIVGGNINHLTRVMTTTIALETSRGNLALAMALGTILLLIALGVNAALALVGLRSRHAHA